MKVEKETTLVAIYDDDAVLREIARSATSLGQHLTAAEAERPQLRAKISHRFLSGDVFTFDVAAEELFGLLWNIGANPKREFFKLVNEWLRAGEPE